MLLQTKDLIEQTTAELLEARKLFTTRPGMALIWVGNDAQTKSFIRVKQQKAKLLDCEFFLYHLETAGLDQLVALMKSLNILIWAKSLPGSLSSKPRPRTRAS